MEKSEREYSTWNYKKVAVSSGIIGLIVAIVYIIYDIWRFGEHNELWQGLLGGMIGPFFLIFIGFVMFGIIIFAIYKFIKKP